MDKDNIAKTKYFNLQKAIHSIENREKYLHALLISQIGKRSSSRSYWNTNQECPSNEQQIATEKNFFKKRGTRIYNRLHKVG